MQPLDTLFVRHGESVGNVANEASMRGDHKHYTAEFLAMHSRDWPLTAVGIGQGRMAGEWIRANVGERFDHCLVSDHIRARHTAALLALPDARWRIEFALRERDWGELDVLNAQEREKNFERNLRRKALNSFLWTPPNGEPMSRACDRVDGVLSWLHRHGSDGMGRAVIVCHGELMMAARMCLEDMSVDEWNAIDASANPHDHIHNGQVLHYTRVNPTDPSDVRDRPSWMRSVCTSDPSLSSNEWRPIHRRTYSNEDLLASLG